MLAGKTGDAELLSRPQTGCGASYSIRAAKAVVGKKIDPIYLAWMYSTLGQRDEAFRWLDRAIEECSPQVVFIRVILELDNIFGFDPRFETAPHNDPIDLLKNPRNLHSDFHIFTLCSSYVAYYQYLTGRRSGLKIRLYLVPWGFDSPSRHQNFLTFVIHTRLVQNSSATEPICQIRSNMLLC